MVNFYSALHKERKGDNKMETVVLRNGAEEVRVAVKSTMDNIKDLLNTNPAAFYELVQLCRDRSHKLFGNTEKVLIDLSLVQPGGSVHSSVRNVVLSAIEGDGFNMKIRSPVKH